MDCRTFQKNLEDYLEGGLDFPGRFGMERHAQQCYLCGREAARAQALSELARKLERVGTPPDFENEVLARIHAEGARPWFSRALGIHPVRMEWPSLRRLALVGASLFLAGLAVLVLGPRSNVVPDQSLTVVSTSQDSAASPGSGSQSAPSQAASIPEPLSEPGPNKVFPGRPSVRYSAESSDYLEYLVTEPGGRQYIMRFPKTIRMRHPQPSEEYFIRNVSH